MSLFMFAFGIAWMLGADGQKYFVLRERAGLISHGFFAYTRNPNYLGEISIYSSFANMAQSQGYWYYLLVFWFITFSLRIIQKDNSLSKKEGWKEYSERSWILLPKLYGSAILSIIFYSTLLSLAVFTYNNGGVEATVNKYVYNGL